MLLLLFVLFSVRKVTDATRSSSFHLRKDIIWEAREGQGMTKCGGTRLRTG